MKKTSRVINFNEKKIEREEIKNFRNEVINPFLEIEREFDSMNIEDEMLFTKKNQKQNVFDDIEFVFEQLDQEELAPIFTKSI